MRENCNLAAIATVIAGVILTCWSSVAGATGGPPANPDFEEGHIGKVPPGWFIPGIVWKSGYRASVVEESPKSGSRCAQIWYAGSARPKGFGNMMQNFDAKPYRGKRIRFRAAVRVEAKGQLGRGQLWLRVDRVGQKTGFFDNMGDRPIVSDTWSYYEIIGDVEKDAERISIGCMLIGSGKVWIDDVSFEVVGKAGAGNQPARPFEERGLENVVAFTRLLGYVRHFHPSDQAAATDWDRFAIEGIRIVEEADDPADLAQRMNTIFKPVAPTVSVFATSAAVQPRPKLLKPPNVSNLNVVTWQHHGYGPKAATQGSIYSSKRIRKAVRDGKVPEGFADPAKTFVADLGGGVSCSVPLAVFADNKGTLPQASPGSATRSSVLPKGFIPSGNDRSSRLAAVALCWNVLQHFYPYFDVVKTDWQAGLTEALKSAATDADERAFLDTLRRLVAKLEDGHGGVAHGSDNPGGFVVPVQWEWIEGKVVVSKVDPAGAGGLEIGDIVLKINGVAVAQALAEKEQLVSAATDTARKLKSLLLLAVGERNSRVNVEVLRDGDKHVNATILRNRRYSFLAETRPASFSELKAGVYYLDINMLTDEQFNQGLPKLEKAKGIVVDFRGYPQLSTVLISHLIDKPVTCARWHVPIVIYPDRKSLNFDFSNWPVQPRKPRLRAKVVFITNAKAISYAETYMGIIEHYKLGEIVGEPTAGTNGNVNTFGLPGKYTVSFTGMKVLKHDGSQHHGVGIVPTVPAHRTIKGVIEGRDELLERALETVSQ